MVCGVTFNIKRGKWRADIGVDGKRKFLGLFDTEREAIEARLLAETIYGKPRWGNTENSRIWLIENDMALLEVFPDQLALIDAKNIERVKEGRRWEMLGQYPYSNDVKCHLHQHILRMKGFGHTIVSDHIDRNPLNNLESNLRVVTSSESQFNTGVYKNNSSGVKGVCWNREMRKWQAYIRIDYQQQHLGLFNDLEDAVKARENAEKQIGFTRVKPDIEVITAACGECGYVVHSTSKGARVECPRCYSMVQLRPATPPLRIVEC
jgi:DNA-directed RNA polymerase subunit RPC12/RpoP